MEYHKPPPFTLSQLSSALFSPLLAPLSAPPPPPSSLLPSITPSSLSITKPWYYHSRFLPILNCKCPYHKKKTIPHQFIEYQYAHEKGCHNENILIQKVLLHDQVRRETKELLRGEYQRRETELEGKKEKVFECRRVFEGNRRLRGFVRGGKTGLGVGVGMEGWGSYNEYVSRYGMERKGINAGDLLLQSIENKDVASTEINPDQPPKLSLTKLQAQQLIKSLLSDPGTKHRSTIITLRRKGYNFSGFPAVDKYLKFIQKQFIDLLEENDWNQVDNNTLQDHMEQKLIEEFKEMDTSLAKVLVGSWMEKDAGLLFRTIKRQSRNTKVGQQQQQQEGGRNSEKKRRGSVMNDGMVFRRSYSKIISEEGWNGEKGKEGGGFKSGFSNKASRRDSLARNMSTNLIGILPGSSFNINNGKLETPKNSVSKIGLTSKLKQNLDAKKKKYTKSKIITNNNNNKKSFNKGDTLGKKRSEEKPEPLISGTLLAEPLPQQLASRETLKTQRNEQLTARKYIKRPEIKHRLAMFKNANNKLLINNERIELLREIENMRHPKKQRLNTKQSTSSTRNRNPIYRSRSYHDIIDLNQLNISNMIFKGRKRVGKVVWRDENMMNEYARGEGEEEGDDELENEKQEEEEILRQLKAARKKRWKMNLINQLLFGEVEGVSDLEESDNERYGSSSNLNDLSMEFTNHKRRFSEKVIPTRYISSTKHINGAKSPLERFYNLKQDIVTDNILENINTLLMKSKLNYLSINLFDSQRLRTKKVKKIKQYLNVHPEIEAKDLIRNLKFYEEHMRLTKASRFAVKLNYDPDVVLSLNGYDDTIIKAILKVQSRKCTNPGFGYLIREIEPGEEEESVEGSDGEEDVSERGRGRGREGRMVGEEGGMGEEGREGEREMGEEGLVQRGLVEWTAIEAYYVLDEYLKEKLLRMKKRKLESLGEMPTSKVIEEAMKNSM